MSAHWPVTHGKPLGKASLRRVGLSTLLNATARCHPERLMLIDPLNKPDWSGRPAINWTYAAVAEIVDRLARGIRSWRLPPESRIGLHLPGTSESVLAHFAIEAAGHVPCALPIVWDEDALVTGVHRAGLAAVLTQTRLGAGRPAERIGCVAARCFNLRYLAAFGPDVPAGMVNLDRVIVEGREPGATAAPSFAPRGPGGLISFAGGDPDRPIIRSTAAVVGAVAAHLMALRAGPGERILSLLGPHDLRGFATGLGAALVAGASLETLPVFDGAALKEALRRDLPTHLVVPAFLERSLAGHALPGTLRSVSYVHRAPARFAAPVRDPAARIAIIDAVAFDETALVSGVRGSGNDVGRVLGRPERLTLPDTLMAIRHEPDGRLAFRGQACAAEPLARPAAGVVGPHAAIPVPGTDPFDPPALSTAWSPTPYAPLIYDGIATAVSVAEQAAPGHPAPCA